MPPKRKLEELEGFVPVLGQPQHIRCLACSEYTGKPHNLLRKHAKEHLNREKHQSAVDWQNTQRTLTDPKEPGNVESAIESTSTLLFANLPKPHTDRVSSSPSAPPQSYALNFLDTDKHGLYEDQQGETIHFTAGEDFEHTFEKDVHRRIEELSWFSHQYLGSFSDSIEDDEDATLSNVAAMVEEMNVNGDDADDDESGFEGQWSARDDQSKWAPYSSKTMFLLDFLDSLPRLRLSDEHLKTIIWVMKECGTPNVPSFSSLRKLQSKLTAEMGMTCTRHVSALGNEFYNNGAAQTYRLDWANPLVRPHIRPYVEVSSSVSEFYQAKRLLDEDVDLLQLMWADFKSAPDYHFYIKEVAQTIDGSFVIPMKWVCVVDTDGVETQCADAYYVDYDLLTKRASLRNDKMSRIRASDLQHNFPSLKSNGMQFIFNGESSPPWSHNMPHPMREKAKGRPTFTLGIMSWADDVSGNRSKQYNPHTNVYSANLNLPHRKLQKEYFVHFSSTSPTAGALEQLDGLLTDTGPEVWHEAYDCLLQREILFRLINRIDPADNPQQSELCSHIGLHGNKFCRRCHVGGTAKDLESPEGYGSLFSTGTPRTVEDTVMEITNQLITATRGNERNVEQMQTMSGIKDPIAQVWIEQIITWARTLHYTYLTNPETQDVRLKDRRLKGSARQVVRDDIIAGIQTTIMKWLTTQPEHRYNDLPIDSPLRSQLRPGDHYNILLGSAGLDVHRDTLVELLHTYLLGLDKYTWHISHTSWDDGQRELMATRLSSSSVDGLSIYPVRGQYMVRYRNNLIGKHFKALQQVGVFHLHPDLLEQVHGTKLLDLWKATGELGALLFYHSIDNMETYLEDLETLIANLLDVWSTIDPNRIIVKPKLHILRHIVDDIRNCGPAILFSTEIFECWNSVFRMCSVLSNHHAPSHDIATALLDLERFKHQVSGGWWKTADGTYVCAGEGVTGMFASHDAMQRRLGWHNDEVQPPGTVQRHGRTRRTSVTWDSICQPADDVDHSAVHITVDTTIPSKAPSIRWEYAKTFIAQSGDVCQDASWVFYKGPQLAVASVQARPIDDSTESPVYAGRVQCILVPESATTNHGIGLVKIEQFSVSDNVDSRLNMPILFRGLEDKVIHIVPAENVRFIFNAQHDCVTAECAIGTENTHQERQQTQLTQGTVRHGIMQRYFINMHAIHNAALIRLTLPRQLTKPKPFFEDRASKHREFAEMVSATNTQRREVTAAKARETRARKKAAKDSEDVEHQPGM